MLKLTRSNPRLNSKFQELHPDIVNIGKPLESTIEIFHLAMYIYMLKSFGIQSTRRGSIVHCMYCQITKPQLLVGTTFVLFFYNVLGEINMLNSTF